VEDLPWPVISPTGIPSALRENSGCWPVAAEAKMFSAYPDEDGTAGCCPWFLPGLERVISSSDPLGTFLNIRWDDILFQWIEMKAWKAWKAILT
jgi:hypothetical protein